jgi:transposase
MDLTDQQWALVRPIISERHPPSPSISTVGGRPPRHPRPILDAILWKIRNHSAWYNLPERYPSHQTCYRRYRQWRRDRSLDRILLTLYDDLLQRGGFDPQQALRAGSINVTLQGNRFRVLSATELLDTWQLSTALVFIQLALTRLSSSPLEP